jgi:uncharacterized protein (TIGR03435 family)
MKVQTIAKLLVLAATASFAQTSAQLPSFEVASVKPSQADEVGLKGMILGGPGTSDPARLTAVRISLLTLISRAYDLPFDQISGPRWMEDEYYDIMATVPKGSTKAQSKLMLQSLLAERFSLSLHREPRELPVYELTVAKGGAKLKPTAYPDAKPLRPGDAPIPFPRDVDGYPVVPVGRAGEQGVPANGLMRFSYQSQAISNLIQDLGRWFATRTGSHSSAPGRVVDKTGLTGKYDFRLEVPPGLGSEAPPPQIRTPQQTPESLLDVQDSGASTEDVFRALDKQLGLKLSKGKAVFDVLVIDRVERVPTAN